MWVMHPKCETDSLMLDFYFCINFCTSIFLTIPRGFIFLLFNWFHQKLIRVSTLQNKEFKIQKMDLETPDSYATQFFGFTPDSFVESIHVPSIEIINDHLEVSLRSGRFCCHWKLGFKTTRTVVWFADHTALCGSGLFYETQLLRYTSPDSLLKCLKKYWY